MGSIRAFWGIKYDVLLITNVLQTTLTEDTVYSESIQTPSLFSDCMLEALKGKNALLILHNLNYNVQMTDFTIKFDPHWKMWKKDVEGF